MATNLSAGADFYLTIPHHSNQTKPIFFTSPRIHNPKKKTLKISCNSLKPTKNETPSESKTPSLSEQLKPLSTTTLSTPKQNLLSKPKSIWVNPTKPRRSVLSLQRQKRSAYSSNPKNKELRLFADKLNDCNDCSEDAFLALLEEFPQEPTRENALLILNSLKPWQKSYLFFKWVKNKNSFPMETIFYNVVMKSLRSGKQFELTEELANEMVSNDIQLDNITYSTIITCAKRCLKFDKALEWFERMYKIGLMPDEVTYSAILDVYAKLGKVEEVLSLYERGVASGWKPDPITFSVLAKMFGEAGDYDGIRYVLQEMRSLGVQPNVAVYNTLLEAMGKAGKPGLARSLFEEMLESGLNPNEKTLTALAKIYGKARWGKDALDLWERMRCNNWPMDLFLYNTLLSMCADLGMEIEAERLFEDMKTSKRCKPDNWSYTAMLNIYGSLGNADKAMKLFDAMCEVGVAINVMGCTCLIQCLGKAKRIDDLVRVYNFAIEAGVKPDDRLCGCLLSVVALCEETEDADKVLVCLQRSNPKLIFLVELIEDEKSSFETIKGQFKAVVGGTAIEARRPFCNCLIDICRNRSLHGRAHELLYLGTLYGLYPDLHHKTAEEWSLDVRSLSIGAAQTALEEWMHTLTRFVQRNEALPELFSAYTGTGVHKFSLGLGNSFASHVEKLAVPFMKSGEKAGYFVARREDLVSWVESRSPSPSTV